jgi:hypothetical protein
MNILLPGFLVPIFGSFYIFYGHNRRNRLRREEQRDELNSRRQEFLEKLVASKNKKPENSKTQGEENTEA